MPVKQCAAWIVWNLDQSDFFKEICQIDWVVEARQNKSLLPWVRSGAESSVRPICLVQRTWCRLALKTLNELLSSLPDQAAVVFSFDGFVLLIRCEGRVIALSGKGVPWSVRFRVEAKGLRRLPKRLRREIVEVSIWESYINLGNWRYAGTVESIGAPATPSVQ